MAAISSDSNQTKYLQFWFECMRDLLNDLELEFSIGRRSLTQRGMTLYMNSMFSILSDVKGDLSLLLCVAYICGWTRDPCHRKSLFDLSRLVNVAEVWYCFVNVYLISLIINGLISIAVERTVIIIYSSTFSTIYCFLCVSVERFLSIKVRLNDLIV